MTRHGGNQPVTVGPHELPGYRTFEFTWRGERTPQFEAIFTTFGLHPVRNTGPAFAYLTVIRFDALLALQMTTRPATYAWIRDRPEARRRYGFLLVSQGSVSLTANGATSTATEGGIVAAAPSAGDLTFEAHTQATFVFVSFDANEVRPFSMTQTGTTSVELPRPVFRAVHDYLVEATKSPPSTPPASLKCSAASRATLPSRWCAQRHPRANMAVSWNEPQRPSKRTPPRPRSQPTTWPTSSVSLDAHSTARMHARGSQSRMSSGCSGRASRASCSSDTPAFRFATSQSRADSRPRRSCGEPSTATTRRHPPRSVAATKCEHLEHPSRRHSGWRRTHRRQPSRRQASWAHVNWTKSNWTQANWTRANWTQGKPRQQAGNRQTKKARFREPFLHLSQHRALYVSIDALVLCTSVESLRTLARP